VQLGGLPVENDVSCGLWILEAVRGRTGVGGLLPAVFEAYARIFHPAARYIDDDDVDVTWAEVARANGTVAHPLMQWPAITGGWEYVNEDSQPPTWDGGPAEGHLPVAVAARMAEVLARHTASSDECRFGRWNGFGFDATAVENLPILPLPGSRDVVLLRGAVSDATRNLAPEPHEQSASIWWPADRAWCVVTDIDLMSTYVGGTVACIADLIAAPGLEVAPAAPEHPVGPGDDPVNPPPTDAP
jgi:hypothetical protein